MTSEANSATEIWGLDFETSGLEPRHHAPIQLGIAAPDGVSMSWDIGGWQWGRNYNLPTAQLGVDFHLWDARAYEVHGMSMERIAKGLSPYHVSRGAEGFVEAHSQVWHGRRKLVGWNVGSFDLQFLNLYLPQLARIFSYQTIDLNAVVFAAADGHGISATDLKDDTKAFGERMANIDLPGLAAHDARWDARASIHEYNYLTTRIKEGY